MSLSHDVARLIADHVDSRRADLLEFATQLIGVRSPNPPGDERDAADCAADQLKELGFADIAIHEANPLRANVVCTFDTGRDGPTLILNGHLDTKPPGDLSLWATDPYVGTVSDGKLYGLGSVDMKGPIAAMAYGLAAARDVCGSALRGRVLFVLSADEEGPGMEGPRYLLEDLGMHGDAVVIGEPCGVLESWDTLPVISRGFCAVRFELRGTRVHNSISDRISPVNASLDAARLMVFLDSHLQLSHDPIPLCPTGPTVTLGTTMAGGEGYAFVPGDAWFTVNIRSLPGMCREGVAEDICKALADFRSEQPQAQVTWDFVEGNLAWTPPTQVGVDIPVVQAAARAMELVLGSAAPFGYCPGSTDAAWWQGKAGIPSIPALGPGTLGVCHAPNEGVVIEELYQAARIHALLIAGYLSAEDGCGPKADGPGMEDAPNV